MNKKRKILALIAVIIVCTGTYKAYNWLQHEKENEEQEEKENENLFSQTF